MSKKLIITLSIVFCVIAVILILFWTLFALSSVSVRYVSTRENLSVTDEEIIDTGEFRYGACVLFEGKKTSIEKIHNKASEDERFAYLKVVNIETVFPNKFVIHVMEREELFAVKFLDKHLICDRELRVLRVDEAFESTEQNAIELLGLEITNEEVKVGTFLQTKQESIKKFYSVILQNNRDLSQQQGKFKSLSLGSYVDETTKQEYMSLTMTTFQDRKFVINNIDFAFTQKVQKLFAVESMLYSQETDDDGDIVNSNGEKIYLFKTQSGEYVPFVSGEHDENDRVTLNYELLSNSHIKIDNLTLTDFVERTENDIYYSIVANS